MENPITPTAPCCPTASSLAGIHPEKTGARKENRVEMEKKEVEMGEKRVEVTVAADGAAGGASSSTASAVKVDSISSIVAADHGKNEVAEAVPMAVEDRRTRRCRWLQTRLGCLVSSF
jgi:hypothetical protein